MQPQLPHNTTYCFALSLVTIQTPTTTPTRIHPSSSSLPATQPVTHCRSGPKSRRRHCTCSRLSHQNVRLRLLPCQAEDVSSPSLLPSSPSSAGESMSNTPVTVLFLVTILATASSILQAQSPSVQRDVNILPSKLPRPQHGGCQAGSRQKNRMRNTGHEHPKFGHLPRLMRQSGRPDGAKMNVRRSPSHRWDRTAFHYLEKRVMCRCPVNTESRTKQTNHRLTDCNQLADSYSGCHLSQHAPVRPLVLDALPLLHSNSQTVLIFCQSESVLSAPASSSGINHWVRHSVTQGTQDCHLGNSGPSLWELGTNTVSAQSCPLELSLGNRMTADRLT